MAALQFALSDYLTFLREIVHDPNDQLWSKTTKINAINAGIRERARDSGSNRQLITFSLTAGQDTYNLSAVTASTVLDIIGINLLFNARRIVLDQLSFTDLNAKLRTWTQYQWYPVAWTRYGITQVVFGPIPSIVYTTEWDMTLLQASEVLVNDGDLDPMPYPYTECVPYFAAYRLKYNERQYDEADGFLEDYRRELMNATGARLGQLPTVYPTR